MKKIKLLSGIVIFLMISITSYSQGYHKRIAFMGNSITAGYPLTDYTHDRFSALVDTMLRKQFGDTCIVGNFAISGRTMLKHGDFPIWKDQNFTDCWQFAPDIYIICLGTNDSKPYNWDDHKGEFFGDYKSMIDTFAKRNPQTKFIVSFPPPAFAIKFDIRDSVIKNGVIPLVDSIAKVTGAAIVDYYYPLVDSVKLFPDSIHPNEEGHRVMAQIIYNKLMQTDYIHQVDTGYTFVNHFITAGTVVSDKDSATLSWTTIHADTAYLNGIIVPVNGSKKVNAKQTTIYTLKAKGKLNSDSLRLTQTFYHPLLTKLLISPMARSVKVGDSIQYILKYQDQKKKFITDTTYTVDWSIVSGEGTLINKTGTSVTFIAVHQGSAQVAAKVDTITSNIANITVNPVVSIPNKEIINEEVVIYPNPVNDLINVSVFAQSATSVRIRIYDIMGVLQIDQNQYIPNQGQHNLSFGTEKLSSGMYFIEIDYSGKRLVRKFNVLDK